jgi:RimJ/RimL family protein N-acetyltransferase
MAPGARLTPSCSLAAIRCRRRDACARLRAAQERERPMTVERGPEIGLETQRFLLATLPPGQSTEPFRRWAADPRIMGPLNLPARVLSEQQAAAYYAGFDNRLKYLFGAFAKSSGRQIGFWNVEVHPVHDTASLHVVIGERSYWGKGVPMELGVALIDWLFHRRGVEKASLSVVETNARVRRICEVIGWPLEAVLQGELKAADGTGRLGECRFGLVKAAWPDVRRRALASYQRRKEQGH